MAKRLNVTIDQDVYDFVVQYGADNRSAFVNKILKEAKRRILEFEIKRACMDELEDSAAQSEIVTWDNAAADGWANGD